jgi:serine protease Do
VAREKPGDKIKLKVFRDSKPKEFDVILAELPDKPGLIESPIEKEVVPPQKGELFAGIKIEELSPALRKKINIPSDVKGVVISEVDPSGPAAEADIPPGSVLVEVGTKGVSSVKEAQEAIRNSKGKVRLLLWIQGYFRYKIIQK